ncbi:gluconokinase [Streptacidiphilus sp. MAP12-16]|uniref:gluconokinase n=1 Tax=Streptacidiphilus sp. MAP12-16 TaxID=3156300 RepID=UPI00351375F1
METSGRAPTIVVVMGVSTSGKTTIGRMLAQRLGVPFVEGDELHSAENIAKMTAGQALDDSDREPWLQALAGWIRERTHAGKGGVVACSALKHEYRDLFREAGPGVWFLHLALDQETARERTAHRAGHFMSAQLLDSQYDTLEPLRAGEQGLTVDAAADLDANLDLVQAAIAPFESDS